MCLCAGSSSRWSSFAAPILTVFSLWLAPRPGLMPQEKEPYPLPIYYYIKELTSTYTHTSIYYPIYRGNKHIYHPTLIFIWTYARNSFEQWREKEVFVFMCVVASLFQSLNTKDWFLLYPLIHPVVLPHKMNKGANVCVPTCASTTARLHAWMSTGT